jgi:glutathione S-transferase
MYRLHIANKNYSSWSLRPWVLLKTLNIPFEEVMNYFHAGYGQNSDFKAFSPTALVPCLEEGGLCVWDSLAIVEYVYEAYSSVWPEDKSARAFARSASAEMHSGFSALRGICTMSCGHRIRLKAITPDLQKDLDRLQALWGEGISRFGGPFLAGPEFTAVDAFFAPVAFRAQTYGLRLDGISKAYVQQLLGLPAMQEWYQDALLEPHRETDHEAEIAQIGDVIEDFRP